MRIFMPVLAGTVLFGSAVLAQDMQCLNEVAVTGTMQQLKDKDFSAHIQLADVALSPTSVGYGPGENLSFETTIADGRFYLTHGEGGKPVVENAPGERGAVFLVRADAGQWLALPGMDGVFDLAELSDTLGRIAQDHGCRGEMTFPFRLTGHAAELDWSAESKPERLTGVLEDADVTIVGVWSNHDKQRIFMSPGFNLHAHFITADGTLSGHVQDVSLDDGATLFVPKSR